LSSEFQTQIPQPQRPGRLSNASQRRAPIDKKAAIEYPFEHGEVIGEVILKKLQQKKQPSYHFYITEYFV
jgi:hypothetical protein